MHGEQEQEQEQEREGRLPLWWKMRKNEKDWA